ncbi:nuclear transport factor 2 family protein [Microbacterium caowuchunii]|uniref:Nuclear transport factor 2 family protein n=1 Tax=Microbacterium caowuchunii TaxID=2614638 RepID=A0A5N0TGM5_9MICO|nr:nuclear transport factor 2 family protein [Microbacterium caowuchunii]KAA9133608.1 nuclear transport factor 2 family protein [Microbacterium caowuchunii]
MATLTDEPPTVNIKEQQMTLKESDLQRLLDESDILKCVTRYARGIDRHDSELLESAFHPDSRDHHGGDTRSRHDLSEWGNDLHATHTRSHQHFLSNTTIEISGDTAHAETYVLFSLWRRNDPFVDISGGRYVDRLERRDGAWGITERVVVVDWTAEAPEGRDTKGTLARYARGYWNTDDVSYRRPLSWDAEDDATHTFRALQTPSS